MAKVSFKGLRIGLLLVVLAIAAIYTNEQRYSSQSWKDPLEVIIFPINAEGSKSIDRFIQTLADEDFAEIDRFTARTSEKYYLRTKAPTHTRIGSPVKVLPPANPSPDANPIEVIVWSLKYRYWAWKNTPDDVSNFHRVRIFVLYHAPVSGRKLPHSFGMNKGLLGLVHAFASPSLRGQNNLVIAHEMLHTVGATDKYDEKGEPVFPEGYAESEKKRRYPQRRAEIMAGRIPLNVHESIMPTSLRKCVVGDLTAQEIRWKR
ncbi:MAG: hypothetical protein DSZ28_02185 [Thiothrix sp.]|nr:MAG: hypothetical protein DSZ28_02185 [Thiothrix sp.]